MAKKGAKKRRKSVNKPKKRSSPKPRKNIVSKKPIKQVQKTAKTRPQMHLGFAKPKPKETQVQETADNTQGAPMDTKPKQSVNQNAVKKTSPQETAPINEEELKRELSGEKADVRSVAQELKKSFFSRFKWEKKFPKKKEAKGRIKEKDELKHIEAEIEQLEESQGHSKANGTALFYVISIIASYLFTVAAAVLASLQLNLQRPLVTVVMFLAYSMLLFFLIAIVAFLSKKKTRHAIVFMVFLAGIAALYFFYKGSASVLFRYSIMYSIAVSAATLAMFSVRKK